MRETWPMSLATDWTAHFGSLLPVAHLLRTSLASTGWLRIHSLPEAKRYPETETEYSELLRRHREVASEVLGAADAPCILIVTRYAVGTVPTDWREESRQRGRPLEPATLWGRRPSDDEDEVFYEFGVSRVAFSPDQRELDSRIVAHAIVDLAGHKTIDGQIVEERYRSLVKLVCGIAPADCFLITQDMRRWDAHEKLVATDLNVETNGRVLRRTASRWVIEFGSRRSLQLTVDIDAHQLDYFDEGLGTVLRGSVDCHGFDTGY
jgi:hypothetical protein